MFGYIRPDTPYLYIKDDKLYKSLYCGVCKSIGRTCDEVSRMTLSYDCAFLSALVHNIMGQDVKIENKRCALHMIVPRPIALEDDITKIIAAINVILANYKVADDIIDSNKGRIKKLFVAKGYKRAKKKYPKIDEIVKVSYEELRKYEEDKNSSLDMASDPSANMLKEISKEILQDFSTDFSQDLFYFVGKWIYLIDALDDYDKDLKKKSYNVFYQRFNCANSSELLHKNAKEISEAFSDVISNIASNFNQISFKFNKDLVENILLKGIPAKTQQIYERILKNGQKL